MKKSRPLLSLLSAAACTLSLIESAHATDLYGFVIGINDYQHQTKLDGAVNDANDIALALKQAGAKKVVVLLDRQADRDTVFAKWKELIAQTKKGDFLVFSYAGHGAQEPEHVKGSESDGRDENFLLADFNDDGKESYQRIVDDEIAAMLRDDAAHLQVLLVADSCHSGTMTRGATKRKKRFVPPITFKNDALTKLYTVRGTDSGPAPVMRSGDMEKIPNVFGISAVADHELDPEITTDDGKARAALSVAVAKAFRGEADTNKDNVITKSELEHFVKENVRMLVDGQQHPQFYGGENFSMPIGEPKTPPSSSQTQKPPANPDLRLFVTGIPAGITDTLWRPHIKKEIQVVDQEQQAQVIWNLTEERLLSQLGDELYNGKQPKIQATRAFARAGSTKGGAATPANMDVNYASSVLDKLVVVERIKKRSEHQTPSISLKPNDKIHRNGEQVTLETMGQIYPYLTLFNLTSDGIINNLYPIDDGQIKDPLQIPLNQPHTLTLQVEPPFGADHFVIILSDKPLAGLHTELRGMDGKKSIDRLEALLDRHLAGINHQIGIHGVYTGP